MRSVLFGLLQLAGSLAFLAGVYLLAGLAVALTVGGLGALIIGVVAEFLSGPSLVQRRISRALKDGSS